MKLYYPEQGSGEPLILLHGNGEDSGYFEHQIQYFSEHYRVIAIDTRGHGKSPRGNAPFTIRQFAEDLREFMGQHGIAQAHILGFSDGGNIALCFALKYPELVKSLILNGANLYSAGVKPTVQFPIILGYHIASLFAKQSPGAKKKAELLGLMVKDPNLVPESLHRIQVPTLVLAGTNDMIKDSHTRLIHRSIPGARLQIIDGDHFIAAKKPEAFNAAVSEFLADIS